MMLENVFKYRIKPIGLVLMIFWLGCANSTTELPSPERIGQKARVNVISGNQAARVINKMHSQSVAAAANVIAEYGPDKKDILYISFYKEEKAAGEAFHLMIEKIAAAKKGPFFHLMPLKIYRNKAYLALGMGAVHYIYLSGHYLLWLQTVQSFGSELPPRLLKVYPLAAEPGGSRSDPNFSAAVHL
ncbi:MAG: hypothetical protein JSW26_13825 [Desulfobacterales bacterium]|nr:MAG: hypothetical protein JSW26_13825 [Desulfobacterales bacterium]